VPTVSPAGARASSHRAVAPAVAGGVLPGPGRVWARALLAVIILGALPVLGVWWTGTLPGSLRATGDYLAAAGRLSGLLGAYLLLVLVALMARIPWLDDRAGPDVTARYHCSRGPIRSRRPSRWSCPIRTCSWPRPRSVC
jgi:hypothetical protein